MNQPPSHRRPGALQAPLTVAAALAAAAFLIVAGDPAPALALPSMPILMTTVAMGAGMLPIALKIGADADFRAPMAIAVIGGLITSTVLSLFYVPVVFSYVADAKRWIEGRFVRSGRAARTEAEPQA